MLDHKQVNSVDLSQPRSTRPRIESVDLLRGLIMVVMAIDHSRDFFTNTAVDPGDPVHAWPALFLTRIVTHICAPGFVALAGLSIYLQRQRGRSLQELRFFLITRGLWLAIFDLVGFGFLVSFSVPPAFVMGPLWVSGLSLIALTPLLTLRPRVVGCIGILILALHNLADPISASRYGGAAVFWEFLHQQTIFWAHGLLIAIYYPLIPWIGILYVGYAFGELLRLPPPRRRRVAAIAGLVSLTLFVCLRSFTRYGNAAVFARGTNLTHTVMSFLDLTKYPPSLDYALATGGVLLLLFCLLDGIVSVGIMPRIRGWLDTFGRVPFFFFSGHLLLLHSAAALLTFAEGRDWKQWFQPFAVVYHQIPGWGFPLSGVYLIWLCVLFMMYWPCRWFARLKAERRDWWLSYL